MFMFLTLNLRLLDYADRVYLKNTINAFHVLNVSFQKF